MTGDPPGMLAPAGTGARPGVIARASDLALRVTGGLVALAGGLLVAVLALLWVPWRVDTLVGLIRVPLAVPLAAVGVLALLWFAPRATGTRWGVLLPAVGWFAVVLTALGTSREGGRLLMPNDLVAALTLFTGTTVLVVGAVLTVTGTSARRAGTVRRTGGYHR